MFFPAAGYGNNSNFNNVGSNGNYWSSSLNSSNTDNAYNLNFDSSDVYPQSGDYRCCGVTVRPVSD